MNQTLSDPLERIDLDAESPCQFNHGHPLTVCPDCAGEAEYRVVVACNRESVNWCVNVRTWYLRIAQVGVRCSGCKTSVGTCWSVFPI